MGNGGADTLTGGKGNDLLLGGLGTDTYNYTTGDGLDTVSDADSQGSIVYDSITLAGGAQYGDARVHRDSNKHLYVQVDPKTLLIDGSLIVNNSTAFSPILGLSMSGAVADVNPITILPKIIGDLAPIDADLTTAGIQYSYDALGNVKVSNTAEPNRADTFNDSTANDHILSGGGDDIINAWQGGDDLIEAGTGRDNVFAGPGKDVILGGADGDILDGGLGNDRIYANLQLTTEQAIATGNSNASLAPQGDWLAGDSGDDTLIGSDARDVLTGGGGQDLLIGGAGDDDIMGDADWLASAFTWTVTDQPGGTRLFQPVAGANRPTDSAADVIYAGAGNDHAWGGLGNDVIFGEGGSDKLSGNDGNDLILGGDGSDTLRGDGIEFFGDTLVAQGNDYLDGGAGNDGLYGNAGDDYLVGGTDQDTLDGGTGADTMAGGTGDDSYTVDEAGDVVIEAAGEGNDTVYSAIYITQPDNVETLNLTGTANLNATGNAAANSLFGNAGANYLMGLAGGDYLQGNDGNDTLQGDGGNDTQVGNAGNDLYLFNQGDGQDAIDNTDLLSATDILRFGAGIAESAVQGFQIGMDMLLKVRGDHRPDYAYQLLRGEHRHRQCGVGSQARQRGVCQRRGVESDHDPDHCRSCHHQSCPDREHLPACVTGDHRQSVQLYRAHQHRR